MTILNANSSTAKLMLKSFALNMESFGKFQLNIIKERVVESVLKRNRQTD